MKRFAIAALIAYAVLVGYYIWKDDVGMVAAYASGVIWAYFYLQDIGKDKT